MKNWPQFSLNDNLIIRCTIYDGDGDDDGFVSSGCRAFSPLPCWASLSCFGIYNQIKYSFVVTLPSISPSQLFSVCVCVVARARVMKV